MDQLIERLRHLAEYHAEKAQAEKKGQDFHKQAHMTIQRTIARFARLEAVNDRLFDNFQEREKLIVQRIAVLEATAGPPSPWGYGSERHIQRAKAEADKRYGAGSGDRLFPKREGSCS